MEVVVTAIEAPKAPLNSNEPAPLDAVPMPKCVIVTGPAVQGPNDTVAAFDTLALETVHPPAERTTAALA